VYIDPALILVSERIDVELGGASKTRPDAPWHPQLWSIES
jgi:hypothetical protein